MQRVILVYDVVDDKARAKVADACLDYGLDRVQYSVFMGKLSRNHQEELMMYIELLVLETCANIKLIPINEADWRKKMEVNYA
ncbi:MAG: CRISPR-associated endonuclease Cas2 [Anaerolineae bacterium]|nr:CRISPR-associated endonuclease Cas2 [Anaerolineae bacterium]MDQ7034314.1 CRISPR-associated endonuclease Cas2 [Anaerolineae bacterium]